MIQAERLDVILESPTVADVERLVAEIRRQNLEIAFLRGALVKISDAAADGYGPVWIEHEISLALAKDFRLE